MIRLMYCVTRRQGVSPEDFRQYWQDERYTSLLNTFAKVYRATRYNKNLTLSIPMNTQIMEKQGTGTPHDGVIEIWWDSAKALTSINETPEAEALKQKIGEYEQQFIDRSHSKIFFTEH